MRVDRRWLWAAFGVSFLLNLFLASFLFGHLLSPPAAGAQGLAPGARIRLLSPSERSAFLRAMAPHRTVIRQARMTQRAARATVEADIRAEPFDQARLAADMAKLRQAQEHQQEAVQAGLVEALGVLSPASRAALTARARSLGLNPETPPSSPSPVGIGQPAR